MSTALIVLIALGALGLILVLWVAGLYNKLVELRNRFKNAFAQIDVQLKRRYDLIPNLVQVVKDAMGYEQETLTKVIQARNNNPLKFSPDAQVAIEQLLKPCRARFVMPVGNHDAGFP